MKNEINSTPNTLSLIISIFVEIYLFITYPDIPVVNAVLIFIAIKSFSELFFAFLLGIVNFWEAGYGALLTVVNIVSWYIGLYIADYFYIFYNMNFLFVIPLAIVLKVIIQRILEFIMFKMLYWVKKKVFV